jgi:ribulose-phosphate 3-epimerase
VDGGVKLSNVQELIEAGAEYLVAGSSVFNGDPQGAIREFQEIFAAYTDK